MVCARADMVEGIRIGRRAVFVPSSMVHMLCSTVAGAETECAFLQLYAHYCTGGLRCAFNCISGVLVIVYGVSLEEALCIWWVKACWLVWW